MFSHDVDECESVDVGHADVDDVYVEVACRQCVYELLCRGECLDMSDVLLLEKTLESFEYKIVIVGDCYLQIL